MRRLTILPALALLAGLAACAQAPFAGRPATQEDILVAVQTPEQRELWRARLEAGTLPPVDALEIPADPVGDTRLARVEETQTARPPAIAEQVATAIVPVSLPETGGGVRPARVAELGPERLRLELEDGGSLELAYRSPSRAPLAGLAPDRPATVERRPTAEVTPALRYALAVGDGQGRAALITVQDSGAAPISQRFEIGDARIAQVMDERLTRLRRTPKEIPPGGAEVPVRVSVAGWSRVLRPGEILPAEKSGTGYAIVVYDSRMHPPEAQRSDTAPFALHVGVFRVGEAR